MVCVARFECTNRGELSVSFYSFGMIDANVVRLRFSFVNVGLPPSPVTDASAHHQQHPTTTTPQVNKGSAPVLAACFSDVFTVFSAKRFPGVVESTGLSRCFATQGIKIPIRKDGTGRGGRDGDFDDD